MFVFYALLLGALLCYLWVQRKFYWMSWKLRGPIGFPFVGIGLLTQDNILEMSSRHEQLYNSPSTVWYGPLCVLYVKDPVNTERILTAPEALNKNFFFTFFSYVIGSGLLSNNHPEWSVHRKLLNPMFKIKNLHQLIQIFKNQTQELCESLKKFSQLTQPLDINDALEKCIFSISCETTIGEEHFFHNSKNNQIFNSYKIIADSAIKMMFNPIYRLPIIAKIFDNNYYDKLHEAYQIVNDFEKTCIETNSNRLSETEVKSQNGIQNNFLIHLLKLVKQRLLTTPELINEYRHLLLSSYETTSTAALHIVTLLAMHPEWQDKMFNEIKDRFADDVDLTFENLQDNSLVNMVIKESLRVLPVVPFAGRATTDDFVLFDDVVVPKGTSIILDIFSMHRNPKYWGTDALEFNPYRFLRDEIIGRHPFVYVPFTKGPRNCIGWMYASILMKVFVIKVFRRFRITTTVKLEDIKLNYKLTSNIITKPLFQIEERVGFN